MNQQKFNDRPNSRLQPEQQQKKKAPAFEVIDLYPVTEAGSLRAYLSIKIGPLVVHKWRLIQQDGQAAWLSPPQEIWTDQASGERRFKTLLDVPREWKPALANVAVAAWQEHAVKQQGGMV